jgi:hypothetical protein
MHGGGNWKLARKAWPEWEWNTAIMKQLEKREHELGRELTRDEILAMVHKELEKRDFVDLSFVHYEAPR